MGKSSISRVYEDWLHLDHQPFRVLGYLALRSIDEERPPVYYAGWEKIALAANLSWDPEEPYVDHLPDAERQAVLKKRSRARKKAKNRVGEILRALEDAGAILRSGDARQGTVQVVALTLEPTVTYTASQWTLRPRYRKNERGEQELVYEVRLPDWQPVEREDPRPLVPSQGGPVGTAQGGPGEPAEAGPVAPSGTDARSPGKGGPRSTHDPSHDPRDETEGKTSAVTPQRNPSTRGGAIATGLLAGEKDDIEARYRRAHSHLMQLAPEHYMDLMNQAREQLGDNAPLRELVIHAATPRYTHADVVRFMNLARGGRDRRTTELQAAMQRHPAGNARRTPPPMTNADGTPSTPLPTAHPED